MKKNEEHIDAFDQLAINPPDAVWGRIEKSLDAKKNKRKLLLFRLVGGVAAAVLLMVGAQHLFNTQGDMPIHLTDIEVLVPTNEGLNPAETATQPTPNPTKVMLTAAAKPTALASKKDVTPTKVIRQPFGESRKKSSQETLTKLTHKSANWSSEIQVNIDLKIEETGGLTVDEWRMLQNIAQQQEESLWDFSPAIGTQYAVFNALNNTTDNTTNPISGGISVTLNSNKRIGFQTGIYYAQLNQESTGSYQPVGSGLLFASDWGFLEAAAPTEYTTWGAVNITEPEEENIIASSDSYNDKEASNRMNTPTALAQEAAYIEIPMIVRYTLIDKRIGLDLFGGFNNSILVKNNANYERNGKTMSAKTEGLKGYNGNSVAGLALNYSLTEQINFGLEPKLKYYFNNLSESNDINFKPVVFGVYTGFTYHF